MSLSSLGRQRLRPRAMTDSLHRFADIHSHSRCGKDIITNLELLQLPSCADAFYSAGIHPWQAAEADEKVWQWLQQVLAHPQTVAMGECGYDKLRGTGNQLEVFEKQLELAADKPVILHWVGAYDKLLQLRRKYPQQQWILHGFRGKQALARQLLSAGIDLSFGLRYNPDSFAITPTDRRFRETD